MTHIFTKDALVISSCQARQCHPETCCCDVNEAAIMDYIDDDHGGTYYGTVMYGDWDYLDRLLDQTKKAKLAKEYNEKVNRLIKMASERFYNQGKG